MQIVQVVLVIFMVQHVRTV